MQDTEYRKQETEDGRPKTEPQICRLPAEQIASLCLIT